MTRLHIAGALALSLMGFAGVAVADDVSAIMSARHDHFKQIGAAMKGVSDEMKSASPALVQVRLYAKRLDDLAPQLPSWFPAGSGPESGLKTHTKAAIWQKPDEFKKDAAAFAVEAHKLNAAAAKGDLAAVGAEIPDLGKTCKTCHQSFREKED